MKTLGIVGGIDPDSTIDYYRSIIANGVVYAHGECLRLTVVDRGRILAA